MEVNDFTKGSPFEEFLKSDECKAWLSENAPEFEGTGMALGEVRDGAELERAQQWQARKFDNGLPCWSRTLIASNPATVRLWTPPLLGHALALR